MTIETRGTISLTDVKAIEYECLKCGSRSIRALDDKHRIPAACGNCNNEWMADGSQEQKELETLANVLRNFPNTSIARHVKVKLEITGLSSSAPASDGKG